MGEATSDKLTVTFDREPEGMDVPVLVVSRTEDNGDIVIVNAMKGNAAVNLYELLINWFGAN